jgi:alkylhydroperoxidase family enzyme
VSSVTRLAPLDPPYEPEIATSLQRLMGNDEVEPLRLFRTIAHHPALLERFRQTGSTLLSFGSLDPVEREAVIHRTTARCGAAYEWGVHAVVFAGPLGLGEEWLRATWHGGPDDPAFDERGALLIRLADALHDEATVPAVLFEQLAARWSPEQLVELVCLAGFYHLVSFACGAFGVEGEPWAIGPPAPTLP